MDNSSQIFSLPSQSTLNLHQNTQFHPHVSFFHAYIQDYLTFSRVFLGSLSVPLFPNHGCTMDLTGLSYYLYYIIGVVLWDTCFHFMLVVLWKVFSCFVSPLIFKVHCFIWPCICMHLFNMLVLSHDMSRKNYLIQII